MKQAFFEDDLGSRQGLGYRAHFLYLRGDLLKSIVIYSINIRFRIKIDLPDSKTIIVLAEWTLAPVLIPLTVKPSFSSVAFSAIV